MEVTEIRDSCERMRIARLVLENLTEWFGMDESREEYIDRSSGELFLAAVDEGEAVGFLCLRPTSDATVEIDSMGILKSCHRKGFGKKLVLAAIESARAAGYSFMQVKTVKSGCYRQYDCTNLFYQAVGFRKLEVLDNLWDEWNPCQVYVMAL